MRRFESGSYGKTVVYWLVGFCVFWLIGALYLSVESPPKSIQDKRAEFQMVFGAIVGIVATLRFVATEAWAQIVIDSEGITKITWRGKESILWNAITDYDTVISAKKPTYRLKEASGRTVRVILSYMGNHASELEAIIEAQIAHLKRKRLEELAEGKITLYPSRDEDILVAMCHIAECLTISKQIDM